MTSLRSSSCLCTANLVSKVEASYVRHCGSCSFCAACQSYSCCLYFVGPFPGWESASRQISVFCACTVDLVLLCVLLLTARINMIQNCCVLMFHFDVPFEGGLNWTVFVSPSLTCCSRRALPASGHPEFYAAKNCPNSTWPTIPCRCGCTAFDPMLWGRCSVSSYCLKELHLEISERNTVCQIRPYSGAWRTVTCCACLWSLPSKSHVGRLWACSAPGKVSSLVQLMFRCLVCRAILAKRWWRWSESVNGSDTWQDMIRHGCSQKIWRAHIPIKYRYMTTMCYDEIWPLWNCTASAKG